MSILYLLVPLALALGVSALVAFIAGALTGQLDDLETPAYRALIDDSERNPK